MCGIAGFVGSRPLDEARVEACLSTMRRRGPDGSASRHFVTADGRHVHLLNARLSIIDLDPRADQPFSLGTRTMTYNGELYNYREVREELAAGGRCFGTQSDTEVLLAAVEQWGDAAWTRLEGMWGAAIFDESDGSLLLSRDRFGEKPLYIYEDATGLYFGSEPKNIAALVGRALPVNTRQVRRFLVNGYRSLYARGETFFDGLRELPSASWLRVGADGRQMERRFWEPGYAPEDGMTWEDAVAGARARLRKARSVTAWANITPTGGATRATKLKLAR